MQGLSIFSIRMFARELALEGSGRSDRQLHLRADRRPVYR